MLKKLEQDRMIREAGSAGDRINSYLNGLIQKENISKSEALLKAMSDPQFEQLCQEYEQSYADERKQRMDQRRQEAV